MTKRFYLIPLLFAFIFLLPTHVSADTIESSCSIPRSRLDWRVDTQTDTNTLKNCNLAKFDTSFGTLQQATITMLLSTDTVQRVENRDVTPHRLISQVNVDALMYETDGTTSLIDARITAADASFDATEFDGDEDYDGDSGKTFDTEHAENSLVSEITNTDRLMGL